MKMLLKSDKTMTKSNGKGFFSAAQKSESRKKKASGLLSRLSFDSIENGITSFKVKGKPFKMGILAVSGMDIFDLKDYERDSVFINFAKATLSIRTDHKYIFTSKTPYLGKQKEFIKYKSHKSINRYAQTLLEKQYDLFENFEKNHYDRMAYVFIYDSDVKKILEGGQRFIKQMTDVKVSWCGDDEVIELLNKLLCLGTENDRLNHGGSLNDTLLPQSISFHQNYYSINGKYAQSVVVYDYAAEINDLTFANIVTRYDDTMILNVCEKDKNKVLDEIQASLSELESRSGIQQDTAERMDTETEYEKLRFVYNNLKNGNEQVYYITFRIILCDEDLQNLNKRSKDLLHDLEMQGMSAYIPSNTVTDEYLSLVDSSNLIQTPFPVYDTLSRQFPFYYQSHIDDTGLFFGYTETGGLNILNTFIRNKERISFDLLAFGVKGGGKSVTLKSMLEEQLLIGNKVMVLDIESEYAPLAKVYDGQIIKMNSRSRINPLQITKAVDSRADDEILPKDEARENFATEISRIRTFMSMYVPEMDMYTMEVFIDLVTECLSDKNIYPDTDVTLLSPESFPTFSDVMIKLKNKLRNKAVLHEKMFAAYSNLEIYLKQLCTGGTYGSMFDGATTVDIKNNNLIIFDVKSLSEMAENVYNAQLFNILTIMWSTVCKNVGVNQNLINPWDRRNVVCLIDEAHRFISVKYPQVTQFIEKLVRRTRKYFAGLWFATQSILDFIPDGNVSAANSIKVILSLVQYRVILKQSPESIATLSKVFPQFSEFELNECTVYEPGQMLLSLGSGRNKLHCRRQISERQLLYMGNAEDRIEIIHNCFEHYYNEHTKQEYGLMLRKMDVDYFRKCFLSETYSYLDVKQYDSQYLDDVIITLVDNLIKELLQYARSEVE